MKHKYLAVAIALVAVGCLAYVHRYRIVVATWHLCHGNELKIDGYNIPVPQESWARELGTDSNSQLLQRIEPSGLFQRDQVDITPLVSIMIMSPPVNLDFWTSSRIAWLQKKSSAAETRTFAIDGEPVSCVGGGFFEAELGLQPKSGIVTWNCRSTGKLNINIVADQSELPQVWEIVTHIRKKGS